jgi:hypothetical protein
MTYYKTINGKRYDRALLEKATELTQGRGDGRISIEDAQVLFEATQDRGLITTTEVRSLRYILNHFNLTDKAHEWMWEQLRRQTPTQRAVASILHEIFGLYKMKWVIDDEVVTAHADAYDGETSFPVALREIMDEFINGMESSSSLRDIVSLEFGVDLDDHSGITSKVKKVIGEGTIYLFPPDYLDLIRSGELSFAYPPFTHRVEEYWPFGLRVPKLKKYYFIGFVNREDWWDVYHTGYKVK